MESTDIRPIEVEGRIVGYEIWHPRADDPSKQCGCSIGTAPWGTDKSWHRWTITQEEPLTVSPSVVCRNCPAHGFVQNGVFRY